MSRAPAATAACRRSIGCVFDTTISRTPAGSRPTRAAAAAMRARTAAMLAAMSMDSVAHLAVRRPARQHAGTLEQVAHLVDRQADHVRIRPDHTAHEGCGAALNGIRTGLVEGLAGGDVGIDLGRAQGAELDATAHQHVTRQLAAWSDQGDR